MKFIPTLIAGALMSLSAQAIEFRSSDIHPDDYPTVLAVRADSPWNSLSDFVKDVRQNPGKISYSSSGIYGTTHVAMEILANVANLKMIHVPFSGGGQQVTALLSGQVQATMQTPGAIAPHIASGKIKVLASLSAQRVPALPNIPTFAEQGFPKLTGSQWLGLSARLGLSIGQLSTSKNSWESEPSTCVVACKV